ncbi:hypothetical protein [Nesterenkonia sp. CF4.4]|uniref:hypothetical protein n=1 Tax=Nesterenkonia sp. CF4.4 TaxID=3373079 RepID=UPI003EE448CB
MIARPTPTATSVEGERSSEWAAGCSRFISPSEVVLQSMLGEESSNPVIFSDDTWDVTGLKKKPSPMDRVLLRFDAIPLNWRLRVKELLFYCIHPNHPVLIRTGLSGRRKSVAPLTARSLLESFRIIATWAEGYVATPVTEWGPCEAEKFLMHVQSASGPSMSHARVGAFRLLHSHQEVLTDGGMPQIPWPKQLSNSKIVGYKVQSGSLQTVPMAPEAWTRNISAAWRFLDELSDDILAARDVFEGSCVNTVSLSNERQVAASLLSLREYPVSFRGEAQNADFSVNHRLVSQMALGRPDGLDDAKASIRHEVRGRAKIIGVYSDCAFEHAKRVGLPIADSWVSRQSYRMVTHLQKHLLTACYLVTAAFTMMRDSEIRGIGPGSIQDHYGIPAIRSTKFKRDQSGRDYYWWISEPVVRAIDVVERLTGRREYLFGSLSTTSTWSESRSGPGSMAGKSIPKFVNFVAQYGAELDLPPMSLPLNARVLRRTMATIVANGEDGQIALALQLKHATNYAVANALTSAYSEPDSRWAREVMGSRHAAAVESIVDSWGAGRPEHAFTGPGSGRLATSFGREDTERPTIGDAQTLARWLAGRFPQIRLGTINHCLGDSSVAACLTPAGRERGDVPDPTFCKPAHCQNSFSSEEHRIVIATELEMIQDLHKRQRASPATKKKLVTRMQELERMMEGPN